MTISHTPISRKEFLASLSSLSALVLSGPSILAADAATQSKETASSLLKSLLDKSDITRLHKSHENILTLLETDGKTLQPFIDQEKKVGLVGWNKLLNDWDGKEGGALNRIVAFQRFYDGTGALLAMHDLTGDKRYKDAARIVANVFAIGYVIPNGGLVPPFENYTSGLLKLGLALKDEDLLEAVRLAGSKASYIVTGEKELTSPFSSRENALSLIALINAREAGEKSELYQQRVAERLKNLRSHFALWKAALEAPGTEISSWPKSVSATSQGFDAKQLKEAQQTHVRPFMVAISALAAVRAGDRETLKAAAETLTTMKEKLWKKGSFPFTDRDFGPDHILTKLSKGMRIEPALDLLPLIASAYIRVGKESNVPALREFGEMLFKAKIGEVYPGNKQLHQVLFGFTFETGSI